MRSVDVSTKRASPPLPQHCATTSMRQLGRANSPSRTVLTLRKASWACCANRSTRNSLCTRKSSRSTGLPRTVEQIVDIFLSGCNIQETAA